MLRNILVPLAAELSSKPLLDASLLVAKRVNAHMRVMFILPDLDVAVANLPEVIRAAGVTREVIKRDTQEAAEREKGRFVNWRKNNDVPEAADVRLDTHFASWSQQMGEIEPVVARFGRLSDLIVVQRPSSWSVPSQRCFDAAVFESGRPTLVVSDQLPFDKIDHIMIAWNNSREASRAVFGAMPLLHLATRVSIFAAPQYDSDRVDPADLSEALSWHGIHAYQVPGPRDEQAIGVALVSAATSQRATLIVMGAYTHSRLRESFLGGVTRHLLTHSPAPLLMSH